MQSGRVAQVKRPAERIIPYYGQSANLHRAGTGDACIYQPQQAPMPDGKMETVFRRERRKRQFLLPARLTIWMNKGFARIPQR